jgi:hypothetical protein
MSSGVVTGSGDEIMKMNPQEERVRDLSAPRL